RRATGELEEEVAEDRGAMLGVRDLGMELDAVAAPLAVLERGDRRAVGLRGGDEAGRPGQDAVAMAGPHALARRRAGEERRVGDDVDLGAAVLALQERLDFAVEEVRGELHAVADAEDRHAEREDLARAVGSVLRVDGLRPAGEDDRLRRELANAVD